MSKEEKRKKIAELVLKIGGVLVVLLFCWGVLLYTANSMLEKEVRAVAYDALRERAPVEKVYDGFLYKGTVIKADFHASENVNWSNARDDRKGYTYTAKDVNKSKLVGEWAGEKSKEFMKGWGIGQKKKSKHEK